MQGGANKITIVTATYNSERFIEDTIKSVSRQMAYHRLEYIIVDGSSTDRTLDIVHKYRDVIHTIISEPDKGIYDAFNKGIRAATGNIIYFLNSDDYLVDDSVIQDVLDQFESDASIRAVYGNVLSVNEAIGFQKPIGRRTTLYDLKAGLMLPHQGLFVKKDVFHKLGLFDLAYSIASDFDATIKLFKRYEAHCVYTNRMIAVFRMGGASSVISGHSKLREEFIQICEKHFGDSLLLPMSAGEFNLSYYKKWLEMLLLRNEPISSSLRQREVCSVAIFGTVEMSLYVLKDLQMSGTQVLAFLDNDVKSHGIKLHSVPIYPLEWLKDHGHLVEAIILAFEGNHDAVIREQIQDLMGDMAPQVISWKQMVIWNLGSASMIKTREMI